MSPHDESSTSSEARQGDLPSGRPESEDDHRTLADRLTGKGEAPEQDDHASERGADRRTEQAIDHSDTRPVDTRAAADRQEAQRRPVEGDTGSAPAAEPAAGGHTQPLSTHIATDTRATRPVDEQQAERHPGGYGRRDGASPDRRSVVARQKEDFGGVKIGAAFFGWLSATGLAVLLTALVAAVGAAVGVTDANLDEVTRRASDNLGSVGLAGGIALLVIIVVSYYAGGYVAGRMARFNGIRQGLAVWLWALVIAAIVAAAAAIWGSKYDILSTLNSFPRWPVDQGSLTTGGIIALIILALASLVGALLGGLAGMYFHRKVDKVGLDG